MTKNSLALSADHIRSRIHTIRGMQVMLDSDLAELYNVETKRLNEQVKRNITRFPQEFMFQLTDSEFDSLRSQFVTSNNGERVFNNLKSQFATSRWGGKRKLPYAFTEPGVAMLSGILKSDIAVKISIQIINAFVAMRHFISANAIVFQRLDVVEKTQIEHNKKINEIFDAIQDNGIKPKKGIFFEGQVFDAHKLVSGIIRSAEKSIILVDNYIDDSVLALLSKRNKNARAVIFTKEISRQLAIDLEKHNSQYPPVEIKEFRQSHDRFLIIDNKEVYHFGASLKDLGKKWFAFSKFGKEAFKLIERLDAYQIETK
ncbi:MAG: ORF6N domain-containing protein [Nanoarchaeota archaeon]